MKKISIEIVLSEEMLGTASNNPEIHDEFIASKAPDAQNRQEEVEALGVDAVVEKAMTVFPRLENGMPFIWDYQVKGFFKDAAGMLNRVPDSETKKLKAFKKVIDGIIFVQPRKIELVLPKDGKIGECQRPLRAQTAQGERIALAHSETVPAGTIIRFDICLLDPKLEPFVMEWLDYGAMRGLGQWRNSGKGTFSYKIL